MSLLTLAKQQLLEINNVYNNINKSLYYSSYNFWNNVKTFFKTCIKRLELVRLVRSLLCPPRLYLYDKKYSIKYNFVKYYHYLKQLFCILLYFKI